MAWAAGAFTRVGGSTHWVDDKNAAINIVASRHDTNDEDLAAGINFCLNRDGTSKPTSDFLPVADNTQNLGSGAFRWLTLNGVAISKFASVLRAAKALTTSRSATIVGVNDPELSVAIAAAGTYEFEVFVVEYGTTTTGQGIRYNINYSGTFTANFSVYVDTANSATVAVQSGQNVGMQAFGVAPLGPPGVALQMKGQIVVTGAGTLAFSWAQSISNANATNVAQGSFMRVSLAT